MTVKRSHCYFMFPPYMHEWRGKSQDGKKFLSAFWTALFKELGGPVALVDVEKLFFYIVEGDT